VAGAEVGGLGEVVVAGRSFMLMAIEKYEQGVGRVASVPRPGARSSCRDTAQEGPHQGAGRNGSALF
jgi:hypothetical protein